jgi:hypothetical protein
MRLCRRSRRWARRDVGEEEIEDIAELEPREAARVLAAEHSDRMRAAPGRPRLDAPRASRAGSRASARQITRFEQAGCPAQSGRLPRGRTCVWRR